MRQKTLLAATLVDDVTRPCSWARKHARTCGSCAPRVAPVRISDSCGCHGRQDGEITMKIYTIISAICQHPKFLYACLRKFIPVRGATVVNYRGL